MMMDGKINIRVEDIPHLTDDQLKQVLESLGAQIGPVTASTRYVHEQMLKRKLTGRADDDDGPEVVEKAQKVFKEDDAPVTEPSIYFGLYLPEELSQILEDQEYKKVYTDKVACLAAVKKLRGSRFKAFRTHEDALQFAESGPNLVTNGGGDDGGGTGAPPSNAEKPSPFRGPKSQDLVKFRKSIERDDFEYFCKCIEENPRYLVSGGDTPSVLQEGFRYNALHVACRTNKPKYVEKVLATVSEISFFQKFYPDDNLETSGRRSAYLTDLYLNTPDKGLNETPLHFASKHGSVECVRILTSYAVCDKLRENKFAQKAIDIVCSRVKGSIEGIVDVITGLLGDRWFVPILRDDEHCLLPQVGQPWSPQMSSPCSPLSSLSPITSSPASPISPHFKVRGYAGPMSPSKADAFQRLWRLGVMASPPRHHRDRIPSLRITDQDKGLERIGRDLAIDKGVGWREYWDFLGEFTNMSTEDGLRKLESYLKTKFKRLMKEREELDASELTRRLEDESSLVECSQQTAIPGEEETMNGSGLSECSVSTLGELCTELEALRLNTSLSSPNNSLHLDKTTSQFVTTGQDETDCGQKHKPEGPNTGPANTIKNKEENGQKNKGESDENKAGNKLENKIKNTDGRATEGDIGKDKNKKSETAGTPNTSMNDSLDDAAAQQLLYIIKSTCVTASRLSEQMGELARDLQSSTVANLSLGKTLRTKLKPEILCLRNVIGKCVDGPLDGRAGGRQGGLEGELQGELSDFGFIHILLASKTAENIQRNLMPCDINILTETMKIFVSHLNFIQLDSSDEENWEAPAIREKAMREKEVESRHFMCVLKCLEKALQIVHSDSSWLEDLDLSRSDAKLTLMQLGLCDCVWRSTSSSVTDGEGLRRIPVTSLNSLESNKNVKKGTEVRQNVGDSSEVRQNVGDTGDNSEIIQKGLEIGQGSGVKEITKKGSEMKEDSSGVKEGSGDCSESKVIVENVSEVRQNEEKVSESNNNAEKVSELIQKEGDSSESNSNIERNSEVREDTSESNKNEKQNTRDTSESNKNTVGNSEIEQNTKDDSESRPIVEDSSKLIQNTVDSSEIQKDAEKSSESNKNTEKVPELIGNTVKENSNTIPKNYGNSNYSKAYRFLHQMLFWQKEANEEMEFNRMEIEKREKEERKKEEEVDRKIKKREKEKDRKKVEGRRQIELRESRLKLSDNVVKKLDFNDDDEEEKLNKDGEKKKENAELQKNEGDEQIKETTDLQEEHKDKNKESLELTENKILEGNEEEEDEEEEESEYEMEWDRESVASFATAASSIEDDMLTPEEGVKVYINGDVASKVDMDVLMALGERDVDSNRYPHVYQWVQLISSYSESERNSWESPYISRHRHSSRISQHSTPEHLITGTPRFPSRFLNLDSPS